ncbi:DUF881 domain-containing protein [Pelotomaculum propionicicum]|uniref:DUF881 domain-containing protein n=1 Tax=Pelotomaculum propionicicum TaxID=258475 RepID=UPI003B7AAF27
MNRSFFYSFTLVTIMLGVMLGFQFRTTSAGNGFASVDKQRELALEKESLVNDLHAMQMEINDLSTKLDQAGTGQKEAEDALRTELAKIKRFAGLSQVSGPGVEFIVQTQPGQAGPPADHAPQNISDQHLLKIVNELCCAGAEAVAVNGQRITAVSEVRLAGSHINVNGDPISPPYHIAAIGEASVLKGRLELKGGLADYLNECGISVEAQEKSEVVIPAFEDELCFEYAEAVPEN